MRRTIVLAALLVALLLVIIGISIRSAGQGGPDERRPTPQERRSAPGDGLGAPQQAPSGNGNKQ